MLKWSAQFGDITCFVVPDKEGTYMWFRLGVLVFSYCAFSFVGCYFPQQSVLVVFFYIWLFRFYWFSSFIFYQTWFYDLQDYFRFCGFFFHFWSLELLNFRICAFGICIVICIGFCLSHVNYVDVYICYAVGQLCFRISGFNLKKEAVSFRSLVDCIEYFYGSGGKEFL